MTGCRRDCRHRAFVLDYRAERERQEIERETATGGSAAEVAEYPPLVTFRDWLEQHAAR